MAIKSNKEIFYDCLESALGGFESINFDVLDPQNVESISFINEEIIIKIDSGIDIVGTPEEYYYQFVSKRSGTFTENDYWDLFDEIENMNY